jgi:hypothetical protein
MVFSIICNVGDYDKVYTLVTHVDILENSMRPDRDGKIAEKANADDSGIATGTKFRVHRVWDNGKPYYGDWVVTDVRTYSDAGEVSHDSLAVRNEPKLGKEEDSTFMRERRGYALSFFTNNVAEGVTASTTWSVYAPSSKTGDPSLSKMEDRCTLTVGYGIVPRKFCLAFGVILCSCTIKRKVTQLTNLDLDEIADYAEKIAAEAKQYQEWEKDEVR